MFFSGKVHKLFAYKSANGWCAGILLNPDGTTINFNGIIPGIAVGYNITGTADEFIDPKYGKQLKVVSAKLEAPESKDGIIKVLSLYDGIGPVLAEKIYDKFGTKSLKIVKNTPEKLLEIPRITQKKIDLIKSADALDQTIVKIMMVGDGAISETMANKIAKHWGASAPGKIEACPYDLIKHFKGIGFKSADSIALKRGIKLTDPNRIRAALVYILCEEHDKNGHMFLPLYSLQGKILRLISDFSSFKMSSAKKQAQFESYMTDEIEKYLEDKEIINQEFGFNTTELEFINNWIDIAMEIVDDLATVISNAIDEGEVFVDDNENIYYKYEYEAEFFVANSVAIMSALPSVKKIDEEFIEKKIKAEEDASGYALGAEQKEAISTSTKNRISVITGGPGRGKTTIINTIIKIWDDDESVVLCAPTGRAAQRMKEQTGHDSSTIHSLLFQFPKPYFNKKLFIVDESSMIDVNLASQLFKLVMENDNNIIFVGDADQLPPVGAGNFFNDLINSKVVPTTVLKTGYRNFGNIASNAAKVNAGAGFSKMTFGSDFAFLECDHEALQKAILEDYGNLLKTNTPKDICILSPMRTRSSSGTDKMNELIRNEFNANVSKPEFKNCKFVLDDRVMCVKNHKDKSLTLNGVEVNGIFNGDCGTVTDVDREENLTTIEFDDGKIGKFFPTELDDFVFAYAITIHKSQGSEYKNVIIAATTEHYVMLQRNLLYTAITRAKDRVDLFGMKKAFNLAVRNTDYKLRNSNLKRFTLQFVKTLPSDDIKSIRNRKEKIFERFVSVSTKQESMDFYEE